MGMDVYGKAPTSKAGEYFRANVWAWRPIHKLCAIVLGDPLEDWAYNDGAGLESAKECVALADKLEAYMKRFPQEEISLESTIRVDERGRLLGEAAGMAGRSPYRASHEHVHKFIAFLRACGGFEIL